MTTFFALLKLQLLSRYADLRPKNWKNQDPKKRRRSIGMIILYAFLVLYLGGVLFYVENRTINILMQIGNPPTGMADLLVIMAVSLSMISTLILSFFFILSSLYLGRDSVFLAALPIRTRMLLGARLAQVWISETLISAVFILPACILFGVRTGQDGLFYVRMVLVWLFNAMMPIAAGSVVATLLVRASTLLKNREAILTVGGLVLMIGYMFLSMNIGNFMGSTADDQEMLARMLTGNEELIRSVTRLFPPAAWGVNGLLGNWGQLLLFVLASAASVALVIAVLGIWYRKLSLLQAEAPAASGKKGIQAGALDRTGSCFRALALRELRQIFRVPSYATNILPIAFMPVILTVMMVVVAGNKTGEQSESLTQILGQLDPGIVMAILAAIMCFASNMNPALSTSVTREGRGHDYMKVLPVTVKEHMLSKMAVGYGLAVVGIVLTGIVLAVLLPVMRVPVLLALVLTLLYSFGCSCLALARDVKKPKLDWVTEQEAVKQSFGVLISMLVGWGLLVLLAVMTWLLISELHLTMWPLFGALGVLLLIYAVLTWKHLMRNAEKYYITD